MFTATCEHFTTCREIHKKVAVGFFYIEEVGNKHFEAFFQD